MPPTRVPEALQHRLEVACTVLTAISLALCLLVICLAGWIYCVKQARYHIRRVSFRLMIWAMVAQTGYNIMRLVLYSDHTISRELTLQPTACAALATVFFQCLFVVNCLITCIAINLFLITCFGINPIEKGLQKWYIGGSLFFGLGLPIIPAAQRHFGPDPLYNTCYLSIEDKAVRMTVVVSEFVLWQIMSCLVASVCVIATVVTLMKQTRATKRAMRQEVHITIHQDEEELPVVLDSVSSGRHDMGGRTHQSLSPIPGTPNSLVPIMNKLKGRFLSDREDNGHLQDKMFGIAVRISLYPISLIFVNLSTSVADIWFNYNIRDGVDEGGEEFLYVYYQLLYAGRGIVFALLCLLFDPCLKRGLMSAWACSFPGRRHPSDDILPTALAVPHSPMQGGHDVNKSQMSLNQFMNGSMLNDVYAVTETRRPSAVSLDIGAALKKLSYYPSALHPIHATRGHAWDGGPPSRPSHLARAVSSTTTGSGSYTKSSAGVASASLPTGLTDDVDVDLRLSYAPSTASSRYTPLPPAPVSRHEVNDGGEAAEVDLSDVVSQGGEVIILQPIRPTPRPSLTPVESRSPVSPRTPSAERLEPPPSPRGSPGRPKSPSLIAEEAPPRRISWGSIPTAPVPQRILARRARQETAAALRKKQLEEQEERRLSEFTDQL